MASMYVDVCESEEFLSNVGADQLSSLLSRDDLSAPSETFVFKSVMQWIKHKKEERMAVAAKVIGAVRLGLVDIGVVIDELDTKEMERVPEIHKHLFEVLIYSHRPSRNPKFAVEKTKTRSTSQALVAVLPKAQMQYFDVETQIWTSMSPVTPLRNVTCCCYTESVGILFAGGKDSNGDCIYCYDIEKNLWERQPHNLGTVEGMCTLNNFMYAIMHCNQLPQRYSISKRQWQMFAKVGITSDLNNYIYNSGIAILGEKVYVLYGKKFSSDSQSPFKVQSAGLHCFDPVKNEWEVKATTCKPHFGSSLLVVNSRLYVAGGKVSIYDSGNLCGNPALVEVYDEEKNTWAVVEQKHIPPNNLGAVEIEGKVYFIIKKFPVDSGIRIPPGELYPVPLGEWENLGKIAPNAVVCYLPVKRESLKTE